MKKGIDFKSEWMDFVENENEKAFHLIYEHYFRYLTYIGQKKGVSPGRINENINDLFFELWENREKLTQVLNHHNYIIKAFKNKLNRREREFINLTEDLENDIHYLLIPSVESQHIHENIKASVSLTLKKYVEKLPPRQRQMIYQKFYVGLSYKEISATNKISVNTVYNTIYNALENLKNEMSKEELTALSIAIALLSILFLIFFHKG